MKYLSDLKKKNYIFIYTLSFSFHCYEFLNYEIRQLPECLTYWPLLFDYYLLLKRQQ